MLQRSVNLRGGAAPGASVLSALATTGEAHDSPLNTMHVPEVDHLVYATPDVAGSVEELERRLGVRAAAGGKHPKWGTRNALVALGARSYLEILGPDPEQPAPAESRPFGLDVAATPRLVTWAAPARHLEQIVETARRHGVDLGDVLSRTRRRPDGILLSWRMTDPCMSRADGIVPFFIDWGTTPHPTESAPAGCTLVEFRAEHPDAARVQALLTTMALDLPVRQGAAPALIATIRTPRGPIELR